jgi:hypothetical protein
MDNLANTFIASMKAVNHQTSEAGIAGLVHGFTETDVLTAGASRRSGG